MVYRVRFKIKSPVIVSTPIHFDAVLSAIHPAMHNINTVNRRCNAESVIDAPLPVDSAKLGDCWVYCCSSADYEDAKSYQTKITKRKDGADYFYIKGRQTPRSGTGRDRCDTVYGVVCSAVCFLVSTSELGELRRLCKRVHAIGGLRKMGFGEVTDFEIIECPGCDWRKCLVANGRAVRNLPGALVKHPTVRVPTKHPYWLADHLEPGVAEGDIAELKDEVFLNEHIEYIKRRKSD